MFTPHYISRRLFACPSLKLCYVSNPKCGTSSILKSLWLAARPETYSGKPRKGVGAPWSRPGSPPEGFTLFSVVRNPYARLLSAYLNKVETNRRDQKVWMPIAARFGWRNAHRPTLLEFLERVVTEDPMEMDQHFRPQHLNLLHPLVTPSFVGRLEDMAPTVAWLAEHRVEMQDHAPHRTDAAEKVAEYFGPAETALARDYYRRDFDLYGYSEDLACGAGRGLSGTR